MIKDRWLIVRWPCLKIFLKNVPPTTIEISTVQIQGSISIKIYIVQ